MIFTRCSCTTTRRPGDAWMKLQLPAGLPTGCSDRNRLKVISHRRSALNRRLRPMQFQLAVIRTLVEDALAIEQDFLDLCNYLFPAVSRQFTTGMLQGARVQLLLQHANTRFELPKLLA